jgi:tRNA (cmo5U34)-methyltransferase
MEKSNDGKDSRPAFSGAPTGRSPVASVGNAISADNACWTFGGNVPDSFEAHITQSVPYYREGHDLVAALSDYFLYDGATMYELGCSTAALTKTVAQHNSKKSVRFVGLEIESAMVNAARANCANIPSVEIREADICDFDFEPADLIVAYYTIQFVRPAKRQQLYDRIFQSLKWGGAFILFEKVRAPDARFQDIMNALYVDFKLDNGFNEFEIVQKSRSLKGVLEPFSSQANRDFLSRAGFVDEMTVFRQLSFEGILAIK